VADEERINPEEDPEAALEELAEGSAPESPARRRRLARAALYGFRDARRSARIGIAVAAAALAVAIAVGAVALTRDDGGGADGGGAGAGAARSGGAGGGSGRAAASAVTADIVARARGGTLYVRAHGLNRLSTGTGVLIDARRGLVLTNFHVIALAEDVQAGRPNRLDDAEIQAAAPCEDLALLKVQGVEHRTPIELGEQDRVKQGDPVVALGYPVSASGGRSLTSTAGVVSSVRTPLLIRAPEQPRYPNLVQTDATLAPGNSGGPLVGADGRLVGVNTIILSGAGGAGGQGYAIGVDRVRQVLGDLRRGRSRAWFGAGVFTPSKRFLRRERLPAGVLISGVQGGTGAAAAGLDEVLVTAVDGKRVGRSLAGYCAAMRSHHSGDTVELSVIRTAGGSEQPVRVKLD
jgi:S1-C subfamily serine protease